MNRTMKTIPGCGAMMISRMGFKRTHSDGEAGGRLADVPALGSWKERSLYAVE
jgi:hypothetical protein